MTENLSRADFDKNYAEILENISAAAQKNGRRSEDIIILAATKTVTPEFINYAIESGIQYIGENRVQEFISKKDFITQNVHRHFIGHLQTNKVKDIVPLVEMIESVHSVKLAKAISDCSQKLGRKTDILLEVNIGGEESKSGFSAEELTGALEEISDFEGVSVRGLMTIPPICEEKEEISLFFQKMNKLFIDIRAKKLDNVSMEYLSMGMSSDYDVAIENGANIVRIGTALFGKRNYLKGV